MSELLKSHENSLSSRSDTPSSIPSFPTLNHIETTRQAEQSNLHERSRSRVSHTSEDSFIVVVDCTFIRCEKCSRWRRVSEAIEASTLPQLWTCSLGARECQEPDDHDTDWHKSYQRVSSRVKRKHSLSSTHINHEQNLKAENHNATNCGIPGVIDWPGLPTNLVRGTKRTEFYRELYGILCANNQILRTYPALDNNPVDMYALFQEVIKRGGFTKVEEKNQWKSVRSVLGRGRPSRVRVLYMRYLIALEAHKASGNSVNTRSKRFQSSPFLSSKRHRLSITSSHSDEKEIQHDNTSCADMVYQDEENNDNECEENNAKDTHDADSEPKKIEGDCENDKVAADQENHIINEIQDDENKQYHNDEAVADAAMDRLGTLMQQQLIDIKRASKLLSSHMLNVEEIVSNILMRFEKSTDKKISSMRRCILKSTRIIDQKTAALNSHKKKKPALPLQPSSPTSNISLLKPTTCSSPAESSSAQLSPSSKAATCTPTPSLSGEPSLDPTTHHRAQMSRSNNCTLDNVTATSSEYLSQPQNQIQHQTTPFINDSPQSTMLSSPPEKDITHYIAESPSTNQPISSPTTNVNGVCLSMQCSTPSNSERKSPPAYVPRRSTQSAPKQPNQRSLQSTRTSCLRPVAVVPMRHAAPQTVQKFSQRPNNHLTPLQQHLSAPLRTSHKPAISPHRPSNHHRANTPQPQGHFKQSTIALNQKSARVLPPARIIPNNGAPERFVRHHHHQRFGPTPPTRRIFSGQRFVPNPGPLSPSQSWFTPLYGSPDCTMISPHRDSSNQRRASPRSIPLRPRCPVSSPPMPIRTSSTPVYTNPLSMTQFPLPPRHPYTDLNCVITGTPHSPRLRSPMNTSKAVPLYATQYSRPPSPSSSSHMR